MTQHRCCHGKSWTSLYAATYYWHFQKIKNLGTKSWCYQRRDLTALTANAAPPFLERRDVIVQGLIRMMAL